MAVQQRDTALDTFFPVRYCWSKIFIEISNNSFRENLINLFRLEMDLARRKMNVFFL